MIYNLPDAHAISIKKFFFTKIKNSNLTEFVLVELKIADL